MIGGVAVASVVQRRPGGWVQPVWQVRIPGAQLTDALTVAAAYLPWLQATFCRVGVA
jgi:P2-related tail formation protein